MRRIYKANQLPLSLKNTEMDFLTLPEAGFRPPIAFKNWNYLDAWVDNHRDLSYQTIGKRKKDNVRKVIGKVQVPGFADGHFYTQVWVKASYGGYREAILHKIRESEKFEDKIPTHDVDHMVSSSWLKKHWGNEAVVNIVLSQRTINQTIGYLVESNLPSPSNEVSCVLLNAASIAKLFYDDENDSKDLNEILHTSFSRYLKDVKTSQVLNEIARELVPDFHRCASSIPQSKI